MSAAGVVSMIHHPQINQPLCFPSGERWNPHLMEVRRVEAPVLRPAWHTAPLQSWTYSWMRASIGDHKINVINNHF